MRDAPNAEVEAAIRPGGISKVKSRADPGDPARARRRRRSTSLAGLTVEQGRDRLVALPGVGRKTAACVLLFAYGMRDVPVDTHVSRVGTRLGLFREKAPFEELHDDDARAHAARPGARVPREPAPPRPPDLPRAAPDL